jgi:molecular chaperone GrpE
MTDAAMDQQATAGPEGSPPGELEQLRAELDEARGQAAQQRDLVLRAAAELDNIRKRAARDVEQAHRYALEKLVQELLPVVDGLESAVATGARADAASLAAGQEATLKLLKKALERFAVVTLDPQGEPFDPERHEAMAMQDSPTAEPHSVLHVVQRGYELNGRLLRPARVIVARGAENT